LKHCATQYTALTKLDGLFPALIEPSDPVYVQAWS